MRKAYSSFLASLATTIAVLAVVLGFASSVFAANLITDGVFSATNQSGAGMTSHGGYICQNNITNGNCVSNLTYWQATCAPGTCGGNSGSASPGSVMFSNPTTGNLYGSAFNPAWYPISIPVTNPPGGGNVVGLDGDPNYTQTLSQTVSGLTVGADYVLSFYQNLVEDNNNTASTGYFTVKFGSSAGTSTQVGATMNAPANGTAGWSLQSLLFHANANTEVLTFLSTGTPVGAPPINLLANVSLTAVPEPASLTLFGAGLAGLGWLRRRSVRKTAI